MSVKDQLEQFHMDGSHTTVKTKRSKAQSVVSQFNKDQAWQVEQYGAYEGTFLCYKTSHASCVESTFVLAFSWHCLLLLRLCPCRRVV